MQPVQLDRWSGQFGRDYLNRNFHKNFSDEHIAQTSDYFRTVLSHMKDVNKILEVGCNTEHNFLVWSKLGNFELVGIEPQVNAIQAGKEENVPATILKGSAFDIPFIDGYFDFVYASGVLMHISPQDLPKALKEINRVTNRYFLTTDYYDDTEISVHYHQHDDMLWRRDMQAVCAELLPNMKLLLKQEFEKQDPRTGKYTYGFLFEKRTNSDQI